jgi:hypothetical protein
MCVLYLFFLLRVNNAAHLFSLLPLAPLHPPLQVTLGTLREILELAAPNLCELVHGDILQESSGVWKPLTIFFIRLTSLFTYGTMPAAPSARGLAYH